MVAFLIEIYQKTLSPDHGMMRIFWPDGYCKFTPTCSDYARQAVMKYGVVWGLLKGIGRIFRCNPWSRGGEDRP